MGKRRGSAFSIAEVIIAAFIVVCGALGAVSMIPSTTKAAVVDRDQLIALRIARNVIEQVRSRPFGVAVRAADNRARDAQQARIDALLVSRSSSQQWADLWTEGAQRFRDLYNRTGAPGFLDGEARFLEIAADGRRVVVALDAQIESLRRALPPVAASGPAESLTLPASVAPQMVEGRPVGTEFTVLPVKIDPARTVSGNVPSGSGSVTVVVEWKPVAGSTSRAGTRTLTMTGGLTREP